MTFRSSRISHVIAGLSLASLLVGCSDSVSKPASEGESEGALGEKPSKPAATSDGGNAKPVATDGGKPILQAPANCIARCEARIVPVCGGDAETCGYLCEDISETELACLEQLTTCDKASYVNCLGGFADAGASGTGPSK